MTDLAKIKIPSVIGIAITLIAAVAAYVIVFYCATKEATAIPEIEPPKIADEIYGFSTVIKEIKDKALVLEGWVPAADKAEPIKKIVTAVVTDNTKIVKLKFPEEAPKDSDEPVYPEETKMSFDELKVGDKIDIGAGENISGNIKNNTEFTLKFIFYY